MLIRSARDPDLVARIVAVAPLSDAHGPRVRSGSALVALDDELLVVQDDAMRVAALQPASWMASTGAANGEPHIAWHDIVPAPGDAPLAKSIKPDFEAALLDARGCLHVFGSGSSPRRRRVARIDVARRTAEVVDASPLYVALADALRSTPNIEGAVCEGDALFLFHRANGTERTLDAIIEVPAAVLDAPWDPASVSRVIDVELGEADGVRLSFTDVTRVGATLVYLAVAEDTPDAIADGPVVGSAIGTLDLGSGVARWAPLADPDQSRSRRKLEGIAATAGNALWAVTDPDDPRKPAELCALELTRSGQRISRGAVPSLSPCSRSGHRR